MNGLYCSFPMPSKYFELHCYMYLKSELFVFSKKSYSNLCILIYCSLVTHSFPVFVHSNYFQLCYIDSLLALLKIIVICSHIIFIFNVYF